MEKRVPFLGTAALALGGVLVALVAAELLARAFWEEPLPPLPAPLPEAWRGLPQIGSMYELDRPGVHGLWQGVPFRTNHAGLRGPERPERKPAGHFRIALIGDSIAMGWGVAEEDTYAVRLERALGRRDPARPVEVLNLAMAGLDAAGAVERLHERGLAFDPDLLLYGYTLNDIENDHYRHSRVDNLDGLAALRPRPPRLVLWRMLQPRYYGLAEVLWAPAGTYLHELDENYFGNPEAWGVVLAGLERLAETARERGGCAALLLHTRLHFLNALHPYHRHYAAVADAAEARGLFVIPSFAAFRGRKDRELWVTSRDAHPNAEAHRILADVLRSGIDALPEACTKRSR